MLSITDLAALAEVRVLLGMIAAKAAFEDGDEWLDAVLSQLDQNLARLDCTWPPRCRSRITQVCHGPRVGH